MLLNAQASLWNMRELAVVLQVWPIVGNNINSGRWGKGKGHIDLVCL